VLFLLVSGETGFQFYEWHRYAGEFVLMLIVFRVLWAIVGSSNVKFRALLQNPLKAVKHIAALMRRQVADTRGHNAAGSWAVLVMLVLLLTQALTGLFIADEDELIEGAYYGAVGGDLAGFFYQIHHVNAELLMVLVGLHIIVIPVYWLVAGKNLVLPMITGKMRWTRSSEPPPVKFQHWWVGLICMLVAYGFMAWVADWSFFSFSLVSSG